MSVTLITTPSAALSDARCYVQRDSDNQWFGSATGAAPHAWAAWGVGIWVTASVDATASLRYTSGALALGNSLTGTFSFTDGALSATTLQTAWGSWRTDASGNEASVDSADIDTLASVATEARLARLDENVSAAKTLATGAITTTVIATGAIDADALATDAVAEIADAVWDEAVSGHTTATTFGGKLQNSVSTAASIADAVLEELVTDHSSVANSVAEALKIVRAMVLGKYTLSGSTFTIYAEDGTTVLKQFTVTSTDRTPL